MFKKDNSQDALWSGPFPRGQWLGLHSYLILLLGASGKAYSISVKCTHAEHSEDLTCESHKLPFPTVH